MSIELDEIKERIEQIQDLIQHCSDLRISCELCELSPCVYSKERRELGDLEIKEARLDPDITIEEGEDEDGFGYTIISYPTKN